jgi:hypothetical protein
MIRAMDNDSIHERPGLRIEHLRQLVRLRRASGWLGILALTALLILRGMDRMDPDLFRAAVPERQASVVHPADHAKAALLMPHPHKVV